MQPVSWQQPVLYGQPTTLDLVKKQTTTAASANGLKRSYQQISVQSLRENAVGNSVPVAKPWLRQTNQLKASRLIRIPNEDIDKDKPLLSQYRPSSTPTPSDNALLSLRHPFYGLPPKLVQNFERLGVKSIYPWQSSCLLGKGLLEGLKNLIYCAPTGGGKSLVADVLMFKKILDQQDKKAILVLPYVALVQEKLKWLRALVEEVERHVDTREDAARYARRSKSIQVAGFMGGNRTRIAWADFDIAVCTMEKANALVNSAIEEGNISQLGIVVLDELHMLDDEHRGYILELMATKLMAVQQGIQIVGMSATLSNPKVLADWMDAKFYISKYRPVPVEEHLVYDNSIYPTANSKDFFRTASQLSGASSGRNPSSTQKPVVPSARVEVSVHPELENPMLNAVVALAVDTASKGFGSLIFCSSRLGAERIAGIIADATPSNLDAHEQRMEVLAVLQTLPNGYEATFDKTIPAGVGFHHAGLTVEERETVADAYDKGLLKVMVATCSLAAGINLPARRVILHGARMGRHLVGPAMLRQMRGRAGRKGKDEVGETYLCCANADLEAVAELLEAELPPVASCLTSDKRGLKRAVLEVIAIRLANSKDALEEFVRSSLLWQISDHGLVMEMLNTALADLTTTNLVRRPYEATPSYEATTLGAAIVASALTPEDGIFVHSEMKRALESFVMESEMHTLYLFTPIPAISTPSEIDWPIFQKHLNTLSEPDLRAFILVGISPSRINRLALSGAQLPENTDEEINVARIYRRAYTTLQLRDICNEVPVHEIALRYNVQRGQIQSLAQTCHGFAAGMIKFCERMGSGFSLLGAVLEHMCDRLRAGARADLLDLAKVAIVKSRMARLLWENGFKSIRVLAEARIEDIVPIMMLAQKKKIRVGGEVTDSKVMEKVKAKAEIMIKSAGKVWATMMIEDMDE